MDGADAGPAGTGSARAAVGDLAFLELVGRLRHGETRPRALASEDEVQRFFAPYPPWAGLAGLHTLHGGPSRAALRLAA